MRAVVPLCLMLVGCSESAPQPPSVIDTGAQDEEDAAVCPPPLGSPATRTVMPTKLALDDVLRVNHVQAEATHNSYHLKNLNPHPTPRGPSYILQESGRIWRF